VRVTEVGNWTGYVVVGQRFAIAALLRRPEVSRTGVYILLGDDPDNDDASLAYIGEGDDVGRRLGQHARPEDRGGKGFWDRAIVITSKDLNLTKAHARYLESRFISLAKHAKGVRLTNGTSPDPLPLPEADIADMEYFIGHVEVAFRTLGIDVLRSATNAIGREAPTVSSAAVLQPVPGAGRNENIGPAWPDVGPMHDDPNLARHRLDLHAFRGIVLSAYHGSCAITGTRVRPVLQAAHIRPVTFGGENRLSNGLLLRADVHVLFDHGYLAVDPSYHLRVSPRLRDDFGSGEEFYARAGQVIGLPHKETDRPWRDSLEWHLDEVFQAS
jgi:hypothetical protein